MKKTQKKKFIFPLTPSPLPRIPPGSGSGSASKFLPGSGSANKKCGSETLTKTDPFKGIHLHSNSIVSLHGTSLKTFWPLYIGSIHQSTHLDVLIPASGDNDGDLVVGGEPDAAHPVAVAVLLQLAAGHGGTGSAFKHFGTLKCFFLAKKVLLCAHVLGFVHHYTSYLFRITSLLQAVTKRSL